MIDKSMCEPKEDRSSEMWKSIWMLLRMAGVVLLIGVAMNHFGADGWALVIGLYLYIEGLHNDRV